MPNYSSLMYPISFISTTCQILILYIYLLDFLLFVPPLDHEQIEDRSCILFIQQFFLAILVLEHTYST
jgi:hypothetical protein